MGVRFPRKRLLRPEDLEKMAYTMKSIQRRKIGPDFGKAYENMYRLIEGL